MFFHKRRLWESYVDVYCDSEFGRNGLNALILLALRSKRVSQTGVLAQSGLHASPDHQYSNDADAAVLKNHSREGIAALLFWHPV